MVEFPMLQSCGIDGAKRLMHVGVHNSANRNAGDTLLFPVVRRAFDAVLGPFDWQLQQAWQLIDATEVQPLLSKIDGVVIGGGGLLLRDQVGSDVSSSGWQWNITLEALSAIHCPMSVFAIGYNRFRGQPDFDPVFTEHISLLAEKAGFFGLRNQGSINALSRYVSRKLAANFRRQLCPTTVLWQLFPEARRQAQAHDDKCERVLAFNAAFDRREYRFGEHMDVWLCNLANALNEAELRGWAIVVVAHKTMDLDIEPYLDRAGVSYKTVDLTLASPGQILEFYSKVDLAFGMRGHAQMIPFGLRRPILSIISHDKMRFLLEDIERLEWGVEIGGDLAGALMSMLDHLEDDRINVHSSIAKAQQEVWQQTLSNLAIVGAQLGVEARDLGTPDG